MLWDNTPSVDRPRQIRLRAKRFGEALHRVTPDHPRPRLRLAVHAAHRSPVARVVGALGDRAVQYSTGQSTGEEPGWADSVRGAKQRIGRGRAEVRWRGVRP